VACERTKEACPVGKVFVEGDDLGIDAIDQASNTNLLPAALRELCHYLREVRSTDRDSIGNDRSDPLSAGFLPAQRQ